MSFIKEPIVLYKMLFSIIYFKRLRIDWIYDFSHHTQEVYKTLRNKNNLAQS